MITRLKIANFKSHRNTELTLRNLTLLTGVNGCGKTSVTQALLLLRQSYTKGRLDKGLDLNNPLVSIGIGNEALYQFADKGLIEFDVETDGENMHFGFNAQDALTASFIPKAEYSENVTLNRLAEMALFNHHFQFLSAMRWGGRSNFPKDSFLAEAECQISSEKGQCELIGNFLYRYMAEPTFNYFTDHSDDELPLLEQTVYWEQRVSPGVTIDVEASQDQNSYNIIYGFDGSGNEKPVKDLRAENIGFGISYTLPVIVALLHAKPGALLIIENPEAHLHPAGQAQLALLMAKAAQRGIQIIVETHSDHIVNGVLVACRKFEQTGIGVSKDNVAVSFFGQRDEKNASLVESINILDGGRINRQPKGFFDQIEEDTDYLNEYYKHAERISEECE